jgi:hypothetical protein
MQHHAIGLFQQRKYGQAQFVHLLTEDNASLAAHDRYARLRGHIQSQFHPSTLAAELAELEGVS